MSQWKEREKLYKDDAIADKAGIYMLYDCKKNNFYVGKAVKLQERMLQHEKILMEMILFLNLHITDIQLFHMNITNFCI